MCGIGGLTSLSPFDKNQAEACLRLIESLHRRGEDAFGYHVYGEDGKDVMHKESGTIWDSYQMNSLVDMLVDNQVSEFQCHTRFATQGDPSVNVNNHPFEYKNFVMAHNGVFYNTDEFDNPTDTETDSFWALYWIAEEYKKIGDINNTVERTYQAIDNGLDHVTGAFAIWLWNRDDNATYLFRNPFKPTKIALVRGDDWMMYASDMQAVNDAFGESGRDVFQRLKRIGRVGATTPEKVFRLKDGNYNDLGMFKPNPVPVRDRMRFRQEYASLYKFNSRIPGVV